MPSSRKNENGDRRDDVLTRLLKTRTILINGDIGEELAGAVISQLLVLDSEAHDPIRVIINSPGGHVDHGFAIHGILQYVESEIITIGAGHVVSMGVPLLLAAEKKNRYALPYTRFMMHQPTAGALGHASDIRITAQEIIKVRIRLNKLVAEETGQTLEKVAEDSDRDYWLDTDEAIEYGLISKVIRNANEIG